MNTNTIQAFTTTMVIGVIAGLAGLEITGNLLSATAIGVSYLTVAALIAMVASDYRARPKAYFAAPVVAGHFQRGNRGSNGQSARSEKDRLAA